ncbi:hypothetical protein F5887DRAFT_963913 [Amanita rubescens]|nr:hypothetical protein F5887DRAFT_963913 [Amanita rubescens]
MQAYAPVEMLLAMLSGSGQRRSKKDDTAAGSNTTFLSSNLRFTKDESGQDICSVDAGDQQVGVMMGWERGIMEETHLRVLNVGFGLGIIDGLFQALDTPPALHVIIEPHPDVLQHMRNLGYYDRPNVKILEGKWQDFIDKQDILSIGGFDVTYSDLHKFFESLPDLLSGPESRFSFFNGLGATNLLFYDVYTRIAELHLSDVGLDDGENNRWGSSREYFTVPTYRLPIGTMARI